MARKSAIILAGFLTAAAMVVFALALNFSVDGRIAIGAQPLNAPAQSNTTSSPDEKADFYTDMAAQADEVYRQREAALQAQVAAAKRSVTDQDGAYQAEVAHLQEELSQVEQRIDMTGKDIGAFKALASIVQAQIEQDEADFQRNLAQLQARDGQMQQELDAALSQLQAAYGEIDARRASQTGSHGNSANDEQYEDNDEEYEDEEYEDDDHHEDDDDEEDDDDHHEEEDDDDDDD